MSAAPVPDSILDLDADAARGIGLLGCGTVGSAVARRLLLERPGSLRAIAVRDPHKARDVAWTAWSTDPFAVVDDPEIGVVIECIGGIRLARELVLRAIAHGKDVVTANKDLIAHDGPWLAQFAARTGATLRYEAAVGGAIPILRALDASLGNETIDEVGGVVNGTTNFVLSDMEAGCGYREALAEAQRRGFAEADPRNDVDGHDAAHKLAILATLAFRQPVPQAAIARRGIAAVGAADVALARERGWRLKLVAIAQRRDAAIAAAVTPAFVDRAHPFARPNGPENVVRVVGRACGPLEFFGLGAGGAATAASVVADLVAAVDARAQGHAPLRRPPADTPAVVAPLLPLVLREGDGVRVTGPAPLDAAPAGALPLFA